MPQFLCTVHLTVIPVRGQYVEIRELVEAIDRTRYGISGGGEAIQLFGGWRKRLREWLIDSLSETKPIRAMPLSGG